MKLPNYVLTKDRSLLAVPVSEAEDLPYAVVRHNVGFEPSLIAAFHSEYYAEQFRNAMNAQVTAKYGNG